MIYVVSGFMRSGTSMLMACLEAGGLACVRSPQRDRLNDAASDALYRPNPEGLYEPAVAEMGEPGWPRRHDGQAIKVVAPWLRHLAVHDYAVLFLRRDYEEVRQSYEAAFGESLPPGRVRAAVEEALRTLKNRRDVRHVVEWDYRRVLADPAQHFRRLGARGWPIDPERAAAVVNPALCRFRREQLVEGL